MRKKLRKELDVKYILKTYWSFIKNYKLIIIGIILIGFGRQLLEVIQRLLFKKVVDNGELFVKGQINLEILTTVIMGITIVWVSILLFKAITRWFRAEFQNRFDSKTIFDLKKYYYSHIIKLSHKFHTTHKTGSLIARISRGSNALERINDFIAYRGLPMFFEILISGIVLIIIDLKIGLVVLVTGIIFVMYSSKFQKKERNLRTITNKNEDLEKAFTADTLTNISSIKYYGKESLVQNKYISTADKTKKSMFKEWQLNRWTNSGQGLILDLGGLVVLFIAIKSFIDGNNTLGTVTFVWSSYWSLMHLVSSFIDGLRGYNRSIADFNDLFEYGKIQNDILDKPNAKELKINDARIEFKNVSFKYNSKSLFKNFNLTIPKNKKVALVGHSGSGKSTLVKLLYRLYNLDKGEILIDNLDIKNVKQESLRSELSIVPQECILFDDTIYNNIKFSNPKATHKQVINAIKFAQLDKTIANFPHKEKTIVGERGVKLSGGEKQRVSIARAILANKKVLVLDEATSALDSKTEYEIQKDLKKLMQNRTSLIIAHRLSTIMSADIIVVLDKGKIVQQGTHEDLIKQKGNYQELWNLQKGGYIE